MSEEKLAKKKDLEQYETLSASDIDKIALEEMERQLIEELIEQGLKLDESD
ncbi:MAG: hypothetical protein QW061_03180 [Candidatus Rehaiarchaeum fermentans]|nr:hypothetical protein [Candidatus Rehaiarchaeum fermentans]